MLVTKCNFINSLFRRVNFKFGLLSDTFDVYFNIQHLDSGDLYTVSFKTELLMLIVNYQEDKDIQVIISDLQSVEYLSYDNYFDNACYAISYVIDELRLIIEKPGHVSTLLYDMHQMELKSLKI